jgi:hypothetical protein
LQEGYPIKKEKGNISAIPEKNLHVKIKLTVATDDFKNWQRFFLL